MAVWLDTDICDRNPHTSASCSQAVTATFADSRAAIFGPINNLFENTTMTEVLNHARRRHILSAVLCTTFALAPAITFAQVSPLPLSVVATAQSSSQFDWRGAQNLISENGLVADASAPGTVRLLARSTQYVSGYGAPNDETPLVHFDFGSVRTVNQFHVWNYNEPSYTWRGFRDVTLQFSNDGLRWATVPERQTFQQATGSDSYAGQRIVLARPISARFVRFVCNSTWRNWGGTAADVAGLGRVRFFEGGTPTAQPAEVERFPAASGMLNVKLAPYYAKGDGTTDDTAALQRAINDGQGTGRIVYLPEGVYLVSAPLKFAEHASYQPNKLQGRNVLRGAGRDDTFVKLRDNTLTNTAAPKAVLANGWVSFWDGQREQTTADWFHNSVTDLTIDIGKGNPGAKGMEFFSNNTGAVRNVAIRSGDGKGVIGLDLGHLDKNGPLLVKNLKVQGFQTGVRTGFTVNSLTFESINLTNQTVTAFDNNGQSVSIRDLVTRGSVTALNNRFGFATLIDSYAQGVGNTSSVPAVINGEFLFARNLRNDGFGVTVKNLDTRPGSAPNAVAEFAGDYVSSGGPLAAFPGRKASIGLPIKTTPTLEDSPTSAWANARDFRLTTEVDDAPGLQRAIDSGARVVYLPAASRFVLKSDVALRGNLEHLVGFNAEVEVLSGARMRLVNGGPKNVFAEQFLVPNGGGKVVFENASSRSLVLLDSEAGLAGTGSGDVFIENVVGKFDLGAHRTWARQLNAEQEGTKITNAGGKLWVLGLKTERAGTLVATSQFGSTEILGGLSYTTTSGSEPMFTVSDGTLGASIAEVAYNTPPFSVLVRETQRGIARQFARGQAPLRESFLGGSAIPLYLSAP